MSVLSKALGLDKKPDLLNTINKAAQGALATDPKLQAIAQAVEGIGDGKITKDDVGKVMILVAPDFDKKLVASIEAILKNYGVDNVTADQIGEALAKQLDAAGL